MREEEIHQYQRQMQLPLVGTEGQKKLSQSKVLVIGAGGLGSPVLTYLAAAGVGTLTIIDSDRVEISNLHRQTLYTHQDLSLFKAEQSLLRLRSMNPFIQLHFYAEKFSPENAISIIEELNYHLVVDCSDNFATRYLINDLCILKKIPYVFASVGQFQGQIAIFGYPHGPCYRCLYPHNPHTPQSQLTQLFMNCAEAGVLGSVTGIIGSFQANEIIKYLLGANEENLLVKKILMIDTLKMNFRLLHLLKNPHCPICGDHPTIIDLQASLALFPPNDQIGINKMLEITPQQLDQKIKNQEDFFLLDVRTPEEFVLSHLEKSYLLPLQELEARMAELLPYKDQEIIIYCHHGIRSRTACHILLNKGFTQVKNLRGGIDLWSMIVDPDQPRY